MGALPAVGIFIETVFMLDESIVQALRFLTNILYARLVGVSTPVLVWLIVPLVLLGITFQTLLLLSLYSHNFTVD